MTLRLVKNPSSRDGTPCTATKMPQQHRVTQPTPSPEPRTSCSRERFRHASLRSQVQTRRIEPTQMLSASQKDESGDFPCLVPGFYGLEAAGLLSRSSRRDAAGDERRHAGRGMHIWDEAATGRAGYLGIEVVLESRLCLKVTDIHILQSPSRDSQPHLVYPSLLDTLGHGRISFATPTLSVVPNF